MEGGWCVGDGGWGGNGVEVQGAAVIWGRGGEGEEEEEGGEEGG